MQLLSLFSIVTAILASTTTADDYYDEGNYNDNAPSNFTGTYECPSHKNHTISTTLSTTVMPISTGTMNCSSDASGGPIFTGKSKGTAPPCSEVTPHWHNHTRPGPTGTGCYRNSTYGTGTGCGYPMPTATGSWKYVWSVRPTPTPTPGPIQFMGSAPSTWNTNSRIMIGGLAAFVGGMIMAV